MNDCPIGLGFGGREGSTRKDGRAAVSAVAPFSRRCRCAVTACLSPISLGDREQVFLGLQVAARLTRHDTGRVDAPEQQRGETTAVVADPSECFHDPILSNGYSSTLRKALTDQGFCPRNRRSEIILDTVLRRCA